MMPLGLPDNRPSAEMRDVSEPMGADENAMRRQMLMRLLQGVQGGGQGGGGMAGGNPGMAIGNALAPSIRGLMGWTEGGPKV